MYLAYRITTLTSRILVMLLALHGMYYVCIHETHRQCDSSIARLFCLCCRCMCVSNAMRRYAPINLWAISGWENERIEWTHEEDNHTRTHSVGLWNTYLLSTLISFSSESSFPLSAFLSIIFTAYSWLLFSLLSAKRTSEKAPLKL